jgi:hypothetical protein
MPIAARVGASELNRIATESYVNRNFKVALVDSPGSTFDADDPLATVIANEVTSGLGGYTRQQIGFVTADIGLYSDGQVPFARKAATFVHNNEPAQAYRFSHVVLLSPDEQDVVCTVKLASRATLSDGQAAIFYFDFTLYGVFVAA